MVMKIKSGHLPDACAGCCDRDFFEMAAFVGPHDRGGDAAPTLAGYLKPGRDRPVPTVAIGHALTFTDASSPTRRSQAVGATCAADPAAQAQ